MQLSERFAVSTDVVAREVGGEMVLLDLTSGLYFGLDPVGTRIWELVTEETRSLAEICDTIEAEFDAPRDVIEADMLALAAELRDRELIEPVVRDPA